MRTGRDHRFSLWPAWLFLLCVAPMLLFSSCREEPTGSVETSSDGKTKVTLMLNWYPEAEHGGFYAALVHGYYADAGLDVEIQPGGPGAPVLQKVARGDVTFGVTNADDVLLARAQEAEVVALLAPLQTSPRCIMVHESSGITSFEELKNVTLAMNGGKAWAQFLRKTLPLEGVELQEGATVAKFVTDPNYAQQAYIFSEPFVAKQAGSDPVSLLVSELGFNPYTSLLVTNPETLEKQDEVVEKMVSASQKGWRKYLDDPEETNAYIHQQNPEMSREILAFGAEAMRPLCEVKDADVKFCGMSPERWKTLHAQMLDIEVIEPDAVDPMKAFTAKYLSEPEPIDTVKEPAK